jgi:hypothetical protein
MRSLLAAIVASALLSSAATLAPAADADPRMTALGVGSSANLLVTFDAESPGATSTLAVTGLSGYNLAGIDRRPADGLLYGLGVNGNAVTLFQIDEASGAAKVIGATAVVTGILGANAFGIDFNPATDRLRVVNSLTSDGAGAKVNNFRIHPLTGALAGSDTDLDFSGAPGLGAEVAIAHDRSVAGATASTLYGLVAVGDSVVRQGGADGVPSPTLGAIFPIGPLGVDITENAGLDVYAVTGEAFAVMQSAGVTGLYKINLASGAATLVGKVGNGLTALGGLAVGAPPAVVPPPTPVEPRLESLKLRPRSFATVNAGGAVLSKARKAPVGTTVSYTLSAAASPSFTVERKGIGRKVGKACKKQTPGNRERKPCPIFKPLKGSFSHTGVAGGNSFTFTGRPGGKALKPGTYRLVARSGSSSRRTGFTIVPATAGRR